ncbi:MAG TPA: class I SAM-dependent methyltransferase, partial [Chloroflexi bacterium]|nr:class I SAM-dependent methyltransferase [Chloroflexota bacterium]
PHVEIYTKRDLQNLFGGLPVQVVEQTIIFGAYDNLIARFGAFGRVLRGMLQFMERTPLRVFGLSHFWVVEKTEPM